MTRPDLQRIFSMFRIDARLRLGIAGRRPVLLFFVVPLAGLPGIGYHFLSEAMLPDQVHHIVPFFLILCMLAPSFSSILLYPHDFEFYVVSGAPLRDLFLAQNLSLFLLVGLGAMVCGFGCQLMSSITLWHALSVFAYFLSVIFPLLTAFNYVAVFRRFFRAALLHFAVFFAALFLGSVPYLICWMHYESVLLCLLATSIEFVLYCLTLFGHVASLVHRRVPEIIEIRNEMYPAR